MIILEFIIDETNVWHVFYRLLKIPEYKSNLTMSGILSNRNLHITILNETSKPPLNIFLIIRIHG